MYTHHVRNNRPKLAKHKADLFILAKNNQKAKKTSPLSSLVINLFLLHLEQQFKMLDTAGY